MNIERTFVGKRIFSFKAPTSLAQIDGAQVAMMLSVAKKTRTSPMMDGPNARCFGSIRALERSLRFNGGIVERATFRQHCLP